MSAFIVADKSINRILAYFAKESNSRDLGYDLSELDERAKLGRKLHAMNVAAVNDRYGERDDSISQFRYRELAAPTDVQAYKHLRCLLYQCMEGDVPERKLYKQMERASDTLASAIVHGLPEFDKAEWA